jgi:drug/metabolite transporter (DMT)-like permease
MSRRQSTGLYLLLIFSMVLFGGSWVSGKILADGAAPVPLIFWRFSIAALLMVPVLLRKPKGGSRHTGSMAAAIRASFIGAAFLAAYNVCFFLGLERGTAGVGGVLVTTLNPILTFLFSSLVFRQKTLPLQVCGIIVGLLGGAAILEVWSLTPGTLLESGNVFFLGASVSYASLTVWSQKAERHAGHFTYSTLVYLFTALLAVPVLLIRGTGIMDIPKADAAFWGALVFLAAGVTSVGTTIYFLAARKIGSSRTASFIFTIPLSALLFSWLFLGEVPRTATVIGGFVSVVAVVLVNAKKRITPADRGDPQFTSE